MGSALTGCGCGIDMNPPCIPHYCVLPSGGEALCPLYFKSVFFLLPCASPCFAHTVCVINLAPPMHSIKPVQKDLGDPHPAERRFNCSRRVVQEPEKPSGGCCKAGFENSKQGRGGKLRLGGGKASQSAEGAWQGSGCCVPNPPAPRLSWKQEDCRALTEMFSSFPLVIPAPCASI